ncbi:HNH endonuclease [Ottowia sp. SB7-C50]|uniref:HNH endonuclease n=1 Tax=Ottowia sp. SB7-C50 TaxID=3081231 RepID=UPI0029531888|nr:HNH endonuclease [Ottowia sp. SB7-C50]WOP15454.1 HNH endonuclease [Ottowia sp. SB7-C50]
MTDPALAFDRSSITDAESVMTAAVPDSEVRQEVLRCLLRTIDRVEALAPGAWSVTMREGGFRLNVGQVEALTCDTAVMWPFRTSDHRSVMWPFPPSNNRSFSPETEVEDVDVNVDEQDEQGAIAYWVRVLTQGDLPAAVLEATQADDAGIYAVPASYKSVPLPQHAVEIDVSSTARFRRWFDTISEAQGRYISLAVQTPTGKIRTTTPFKRTHSPGLVEYARAFCATPQVEPSPPDDETAQQTNDHGQVDYFEGRPTLVQSTRYERDASARRACLAHHGCACVACGFDFGKAYGPVAERYIQVHHLTPLASMEPNSVTNAISDLRPLCANCHAVAHFKSPPYSVDEIKAFLNQEPKHE